MHEHLNFEGKTVVCLYYNLSQHILVSRIPIPPSTVPMAAAVMLSFDHCFRCDCLGLVSTMICKKEESFTAQLYLAKHYKVL